MAKLRVNGATQRLMTSVDEFVSVNFTDTSGIVAANQSPDAKNMIRDVPGKVRKCMGYELMQTFDGSINGYHTRRGDEVGLIHAGTKLYRGDEVLFANANDARSKSFQMGDKLFIIDGKALLVYDGETVKPASDGAYIPTITIAKASENATGYEAVNLLQPKYMEQFYTSTATTFTMSLAPLDAGSAVKVEWKNATGEWEDITNKVTSINHATATITLSAAQKISITGEDNIRITAQKTVDGYADRINKCTIGILFGVNGATDRLFLSGNPDIDYINYDWYSGQNDPTYFPDTGYSVLGMHNSAVMGYSIVNNYLATHKDDRETDRNIVVRSGNLVDGEPAFPIINTMQGPGVIAKGSLQYLETEPLFLTSSGVYALTTSDLSGERYSQRRSYFVDGKLKAEANREDAIACIYNDMYWLCLNGVAYILDGLQPMRTDRSAPYSTRQYAGFYRTNVDANAMWVDGERLWFGTKDGKVYRFYADKDAPASYNDDGAPIDSYWTVPLNFGSGFWLNKNFRRLSVLVDSAPVTSIELWVMEDSKWSLEGEESEETRYFSWRSIVWNSFTWATDITPVTLTEKISAKKVDKVQFRFRNAKLGEPFSILQYACEYTTGSYFKR